MINRIKDKLIEIEKYLEEFESIIPETFDDYDLKEKAACERYVEKIVEAVIDSAFLTIKYKRFELPEDDKNSFDILHKNKIISEKVCNNLKLAKGMRNIISHQYSKIDDKIVFDSITKELSTDVKKYVIEINKSLKL